MQTLGLVLAGAGALVYLAGTAIGRRNRKELKHMQDAGKDDKAFVDLVAGGMLMVKLIGAVLIATGALFVFTS